MAEDLSEALGRNIPLSEMIESLRQELKVAASQGEGDRVRFEVKKVELELQIGITRGKANEAKWKFWVVEFGGKRDKSQQDTHVFRLELEPKYFDPMDSEKTPKILTVSGQETKKIDQGK
jgi:hypothetical protein